MAKNGQQAKAIDLQNRHFVFEKTANIGKMRACLKMATKQRQ